MGKGCAVMVCRHRPGDPNCSSHPSNAYAREREDLAAREAALKANTPDPYDYEIVAVEREGAHLVMKVKYPSCAKCAYEGTKVLVYLNVSETEVLRWRRIDPHFSDPGNARTAQNAPPPSARFPASPEGWADAIAYAKSKGQR